MTHYAWPLLVLVAVIAAFFAIARGSYRSFGLPQLILQVIVALPLLGSGIFLHFFRTAVSASVIPPAFPARTFLVIFTGVAEIAGAVGLFVPRFTRAAAFWIAVMMVAVFPANVYGAGQVIDGLRFPSVPVRLAMQVVYILLVLLAGYGIPGSAKPRPT
jgi:uncharacterized membrane protein